jgi:Transposase DDE domain
MALVALWDYKKLAQSAKRLTKQSQGNGTQFSQIALEIRNMVVMFLFAFFLWPLIVYMEIVQMDKK